MKKQSQKKTRTPIDHELFHFFKETYSDEETCNAALFEARIAYKHITEEKSHDEDFDLYDNNEMYC
jgi:hypothetical protein